MSMVNQGHTWEFFVVGHDSNDNPKFLGHTKTCKEAVKLQQSATAAGWRRVAVYGVALREVKEEPHTERGLCSFFIAALPDAKLDLVKWWTWARSVQYERRIARSHICDGPVTFPSKQTRTSSRRPRKPWRCRLITAGQAKNRRRSRNVARAARKAAIPYRQDTKGRAGPPRRKGQRGATGKTR